MSIDPERDSLSPAEPGADLPEGAESPPPGTQTMAVARWVLVALIAAAAASTWIYFARTGDVEQSRPVARFVCPMHRSVVSAAPGVCPICGMELVAVSTTGVAPQPAGGPGPTAPRRRYYCPMHPEVESDDPNAVCPKCGGMKLLPRPTPSAADASPGAGAADLAPVYLSPERVQLIGMKTALVAEETLSPTLRTVGEVEADEGAVALVTSRFSGWVEALLVSRSGERVHKGQVLARIYSPELATPQLNYLNAVKWARDQAAQAGAAASAVEGDARSRLLLLGVGEPDIVELERRSKPLDAVSVRAPRDGYVGKRTAQEGLYVTPGEELFEIADLSGVWVLADVYESEIEGLRVGQKASLAFPALPGRTFSGRVSFVYPAVNPESRTLAVRLEVEDPHPGLRPGMLAEVTLELGAVEGLVVPAEALVDTGERQYLFVARPGGRFEPRLVAVGARTGDRVQIRSGVSPGERVVTTGNFLVDSESHLRAALEGFGHSGEPAPAAPRGERYSGNGP